jgi:hypothetical protein
MHLSILNGTFAICRLLPGDPLPAWLPMGGFVSFTRTDEELSVVCSETVVPEGIRSERGWRILKVQGPLDFSLTGILASLSGVLADANISLFAISTFDTDYLLVLEAQLEQAVAVLGRSGHSVD